MLDSERLSGGEKLMDDLAMLGFEPAAFRRREPLVRDEKIADDVQSVPHVIQFLFEATAKRADIRRGTTRRPHRIEGRREQRLTLIRMVASAIGADQGERLLSFQTMLHYRFAHRRLCRFVERTERMGQRDPHLADVDSAHHCFAQPLGHHQTGRDPRRLSAQNASDTFGTELLLVADGMHHPCFVHRRERSWRTIGLEKRDLLQKARHPFRSHRHLRKPGASPSFEPFESVDDLVKTVRRFCDTKRQIIEAYRSFRCCSAA